jgi:hypothetical protein
MKDVTFYLEYSSLKEKSKGTRKNLGNHSGNCLAVHGAWFKSNQVYCKETVAGLPGIPNSVCCGSSTSNEYLTEHCKRISEKQAREIHPNLFEYLDK